jgi:CHAD domain-containing protein
MTPAQGLHAVLLTCQTQILANADPIAGGEFGPEHVHQLRVGLRRLRSGLRLFARVFDGLPPTAAQPELLAALTTLSEAAATFFRLLGDARDGDVLAGLWAPAVQAALRVAGLEPLSAPAPVPAAAVTTGATVVAIVQAAPQQAMLADLARLIEQLAQPAARLRRRKAAPHTAPNPPKTPPQTPLPALLRRRLQRWHTQVCADAARFAELDIEARHQLRKRLKRLRYGLEFYSQLVPARRLRSTLKPLQQAQQVLGELNDLALAISVSRADLANNPQAWFALGWLSARQQQLLDSALPVMQRLAAADAVP